MRSFWYLWNYLNKNTIFNSFLSKIKKAVKILLFSETLIFQKISNLVIIFWYLWNYLNKNTFFNSFLSKIKKAVKILLFSETLRIKKKNSTKYTTTLKGIYYPKKKKYLKKNKYQN